jgi:2-keto-3-deoxy-L-rhamnonate aldolase RhmA
MSNIFTDTTGQSRILWGTAINTGSPRAAELAGRVGFDVVWIEMEHASADLRAAEELCIASENGGAIPLIRTVGYRREHILQALEVGGRIIVAPMVNDAAAAREMVRWGKFRPLGERGYNTRSRAAGYGLAPLPMEQMNADTYLFPQIETLEAVENLDEILAVEGLGGIFIGPGDLSCDLGCPGSLADPELQKVICGCIARARAADLHAAILINPGPLLDAALAAGADLCIIASDLGAIIQVWREQLARLQNSGDST